MTTAVSTPRTKPDLEEPAPIASFQPSPFGAIRHWLVAGPKITPYSGPPASDQVMRRDSLDYATIHPPDSAGLGDPSHLGQPWRYHDPGRNEFVEFSTFYTEPTVVEYHAFTEIAASQAGEWVARFWSAGATDLWLNGIHLDRLNVTRYRNPDWHPITLTLAKGVNRLCVRVQCLGLRDTRILFGLFLDRPNGVTVRMSRAARIAAGARWIDQVRAPSGDLLQTQTSAPFDAVVVAPGQDPIPWPQDFDCLRLAAPLPDAVTVELDIDGVMLSRELEIPCNRPPATPCRTDRREAHLRYIAKAGVGAEPPAAWNALALPLIARRLLGWETAGDLDLFASSLAMIESRYDCSDFVLAGLFRMELLKLTTPGESKSLRECALRFRYWDDEPGSDAMCFRSENHSLLFHGCQLLAGRLYQSGIFSNSGRTGAEQAVLARQRIWHWLEEVETRGFKEFNSGTYIPITIGAMLNVVDFCDDPELSRRMSHQIDGIFMDLARHTFGNAVISPQGRVYRDVLHPETSGTLVLMAYATETVDVDLESTRTASGTGDWVAFLASSPDYRPPSDLGSVVEAPVTRTYRNAEAQIVLEKTPAYLLTSLAVPAVPREGERPDDDLRPGGAGYQQHLWQATLGNGCHIFVNHPGGFFDGTLSRPGYWHGNGLLPRLKQSGNWLHAIYVISDGTKTQPEITPAVWEWGSSSTVRPYDLHPIPFTHLHWPADAFDEVRVEEGWRLARRGRGLLGVWCSEPLVPHDDILTDRELRAYSFSSAWVVVCGDLESDGSFDHFVDACKEREPRFDRHSFTLHERGVEPTRWWERDEPIPS